MLVPKSLCMTCLLHSRSLENVLPTEIQTRKIKDHEQSGMGVD